jgi:hypothetical protein
LSSTSEFLGKAELDHLGAGIEDRDVGWADVVRVGPSKTSSTSLGRKPTVGRARRSCSSQRVGEVETLLEHTRSSRSTGGE